MRVGDKCIRSNYSLCNTQGKCIVGGVCLREQVFSGKCSLDGTVCKPREDYRKRLKEAREEIGE